MNKGSGFVEPLIINCALLGPTGSKKSPITGVVIGPIKKLQADEELRHKSMMDDYKRACKAEKGKKKTEQEEHRRAGKV
ncbi:MAG: DUF3987 domain-containing protein [Synechococcales cyanobacterium CRU_2_2]|nr:DUF3987 domain-containing protein [Synechococcales cyanobacterium CRU_2_2]